MQWCGLKFLHDVISDVLRGHHWCSGVDWNIDELKKTFEIAVTTDAVVWIEIFKTSYVNCGGWRHIRNAVVWIEIFKTSYRGVRRKSPLMQWCGLKCNSNNFMVRRKRHHWCSGVDWNTCYPGRVRWCLVTTDAVVWIEISILSAKSWSFPSHHWCSGVDWNLGWNGQGPRSWLVTTDAVVWIEIHPGGTGQAGPGGHHWCSGVDWNKLISPPVKVVLLSPLMQWCGLKSLHPCIDVCNMWSPLMQWCGLKSLWLHRRLLICLSPLMQWCGLKYTLVNIRCNVSMSPLMQWCGLKL